MPHGEVLVNLIYDVSVFWAWTFFHAYVMYLIAFPQIWDMVGKKMELYAKPSSSDGSKLQ